MKSAFEEMGGTYREENGYLIPNLALPEETVYFGRYGQLHLKFIKDNKKGFYTTLLLKGKLSQYLVEVEKTAHDYLEQLMRQMAKQQGVTEQLKMTDQLKWVGMMNNIKACAEEIIFQEVIYA